jgi:hypothetical protein
MTGDMEFKSLNFLKDYNKVSEAIDNEAKLTSKKTKLIGVMAVVKTMLPEETDLLAKYTAKLKAFDAEYMAWLKTQTKTTTQKDNWATYEQLVDVLKIMKKKLKDKQIFDRPVDVGLSRREYDDLQKYIVFKTYLTFPLRNDIADMKHLKEKEYKRLTEKERKSFNYIVEYNRTKHKFHINVFKNSKRFGARTYDIPVDLNNDIKYFFKFNESGYFITLSDRTTPISPNALSQLLTRISLEYLEKRISSSMIRHITASHLAKDQPSIAQEEKIADMFLHSSDMNKLYVKKD